MEPKICAGEGCGKVIPSGVTNKKYCSRTCKLSPSIRAKREEKRAQTEVLLWMESSHSEHCFRERGLPCPFCGQRPSRVQYRTEPSRLMWVTCCFGIMKLAGSIEEVLEKWNRRIAVLASSA